MSTVRKIALVVLAAALLGALGVLYWSSRTVTGYLAARPLTRYQQITEEDLAPVSLPAGRQAGFEVVTSKDALVGRYAAEPVVSGALFSPGMVVDEPPALRVFRTGKELPQGLRAYPLSLASGLAPELNSDDVVDVVLVNPREGKAKWLLSNVEPLAILMSQSGAPATYILGLSAEQIAVVEGAVADATVSGSGAYLKLLLSQSRNEPITPGTEFPYRDIDLARTGAGH